MGLFHSSSIAIIMSFSVIPVLSPLIALFIANRQALSTIFLIRAPDALLTILDLNSFSAAVLARGLAHLVFLR